MYYATIKKNDVANGPGVRVNLFVSGCTHHCKNCFNGDTWDFSYGAPFGDEQLSEILEALSPNYIKGFTFLGGEPMEPANRCEVLRIAKAIREHFPEKSIWLYSGYLTEELMAWAGLVPSSIVPDNEACPRNRYFEEYKPANDAAELAELLSLIDVIVDGEYVEERKNLRLKFRGSENQRLVDVKETLSAGEVITLSL